MANISKPPPRLVNEDLIVKSTAKRPISKLMNLTEAPDPDEKKSFLGSRKPKTTLSRAERRRLEKERKERAADGSDTPSLKTVAELEREAAEEKARLDEAAEEAARLEAEREAELKREAAEREAELERETAEQEARLEAAEREAEASQLAVEEYISEELVNEDPQVKEPLMKQPIFEQPETEEIADAEFQFEESERPLNDSINLDDSISDEDSVEEILVDTEQTEQPFDQLVSEAVSAEEELQADLIPEEVFNDDRAPNTGETRLIATYTNLAPEHLVELAKSEQEIVRAAVAANPSTPVKTLIKMKKDKDVKVIVSLIGNPSLPAKALPSFLSRAKKNDEILAALVEREDMAPSLAKRLGKLIPE